MGPQGICFWDSAGNHVFRYNEFMTDDDHFGNDIFGAGPNRSLRGFPGGDSDVHGNHIEGCWDDGLEMEGGGCNVRVWGNYINRTMVKIAIAGLSVGPIYVFRNVAGSSRYGDNGWGGGPFLKMGEAPLTGGGRAYIFHNTILQPPGPPEARGSIGCSEGLSPVRRTGNALRRVAQQHPAHAQQDRQSRSATPPPQPTHDYDYDLISGMVVSAGNQEQHGVIGVPVYAASRPAGDFSLDPASPGFDAGVRIPNFNDDFRGQAPDIGAFEAGSAPMEFGVNAYRRAPAAGTVSNDLESLRNGIEICMGVCNRGKLASTACDCKEWQVVDGLENGSLIAERPDATPNPAVEVRESLPDGTEFKAVWSHLRQSGVAKLVTIHFFDRG